MRPRTLSRGRIAAYGLGDLGFNLAFTGLNLYLLFYYTTALGIAPGVAGLMVLGPVLWDAVTDPVMGWLASRSPFRRRRPTGRYRPYLLFGAPVVGASFALMFAAPLLFPGAVIASSVIAHLVFRTAYTLVNIPYSTLSAVMTNDAGQRSGLATSRMVGAILGGVTAAVLVLPVAQTGETLAQGFGTVGLVFGALATVLLLIVFTTSREVEPPESGPRPTTRESVSFLRHNSAFWILFAAIFIYAGTSAVGSNSLVIYAGAVTGATESAGVVLFVTLLSAAVSVPFWGWLSVRWGSKSRVWVVAGTLTALIGLAQAWWRPDSMIELLCSQIAIGLTAGAVPVMFWAMVPDTVEWGEWRSGVRDESVGFGLVQFALKSATGVGIGSLGWMLGRAGYEAGNTLAPQTLDIVSGLTFALPAFGALASVAIIARYPLTARRHSEIVAGLDA